MIENVAENLNRSEIDHEKVNSNEAVVRSVFELLNSIRERPRSFVPILREHLSTFTEDGLHYRSRDENGNRMSNRCDPTTPHSSHMRLI